MENHGNAGVDGRTFERKALFCLRVGPGVSGGESPPYRMGTRQVPQNKTEGTELGTREWTIAGSYRSGQSES